MAHHLLTGQCFGDLKLLKGELTIKNRMHFFLMKMYKYYQEVTNHKKNLKI